MIYVILMILKQLICLRTFACDVENELFLLLGVQTSSSLNLDYC